MHSGARWHCPRILQSVCHRCPAFPCSFVPVPLGMSFALCNAYANYLSLHVRCGVPCYVVRCRLAWCVVSAFGIKLGPCGPNLIGS